MKKIVRLGTRGSPLALVQAEDVRKKLLTAHPDLAINGEIEIVSIRTSGDWKPEQKERSFIELGGNKGLFTKEIEEALLGKHIDMAVHSMKDVESRLPAGLEIAAILERLDPRDAFISPKARTLDELPNGAIVGTSSLRRQSQILARRPDLRVMSLRGNIDTRLKKLEAGIADATLLAVAGMMRLDVVKRMSSIMETDIMLPAAAQGALGIQIRADDKIMRGLLVSLNVPDAALCVTAERALLKTLDGSCQTPIAALANLTGTDQITLEAMVAKPDGTHLLRLTQTGPCVKAEAVGNELGLRLKARLPADFFAA
jgi:hydroxymethylbilane synthase